MSPVGKGLRSTSRWSGIGLVVGLLLLWVLLWGQLTWLSVLTGLILAIVVSVVFYLPAIDIDSRFNLWFLAVFVVRLLVDIWRGSMQVAWLALKPRFVPSNAILAIPLLTRSDLIMMWTAESISIVPGSFVVDIDREESVLYVHTIDMHSEADLDAFCREVRATEKRIVLAVGSRVDVERVEGHE